MKVKILFVTLIGLLLSVGMFLVSCESPETNCPKNKRCVVYFTGTGINSPPVIDWNKTNRCGDSRCSTSGNFSATSGYYTFLECNNKCGEE